MSLHDDVVKMTKLHLGPAAERFVNRQISGRLDEEESVLTVASG